MLNFLSRNKKTVIGFIFFLFLLAVYLSSTFTPYYSNEEVYYVYDRSPSSFEARIASSGPDTCLGVGFKIFDEKSRGPDSVCVGYVIKGFTFSVIPDIFAALKRDIQKEFKRRTN